MTIAPGSIRNPLAFQVQNLHPIMRKPTVALLPRASALTFTLGREKAHFQPFEGYRTAERQKHLFTVEKTTKAGPWKSAHQYGLAVDFAVWIMGKNARWSWDPTAPWKRLRDEALAVGLDIPISWDQGHVEHPIWQKLQIIMK